MFLSVSGHSSELSIANHSPRSTVSQIKCVSDTISSWFENYQPQKTKISSVIYAPFFQNSNQMGSRLTVTTSFPRAIFQLLQFSGQRPILLSLQVFIQRGATLESGLTVARFFSTNHDSLLRIATNEIASFWIDHRSRQMAFFVQRRGKGGAKGRLSRYVEIFWNEKGFSLLYKTNRFHVAVRLIQK